MFQKDSQRVEVQDPVGTRVRAGSDNNKKSLVLIWLLWGDASVNGPVKKVDFGRIGTCGVVVDLPILSFEEDRKLWYHRKHATAAGLVYLCLVSIAAPSS